MHRYKCHKIVEAAKIVSRVGTAVRVEDGSISEIVVVPDDWPARFLPESPADLGYLVRYKGGYYSWSPTGTFEDGYDRLG